MVKFNYILTTLTLLLAITSCAKEEGESVVMPTKVISFGIDEIAQSRVDYNDNNGKIEATFEVDDEIGVYAFFNNFYYYYNDYQVAAESVIFANQGHNIKRNGDGSLYAISTNPLMSWTFSSIYGTAPHTIDCVGYRPFRMGYNTNYVHMFNNESGAATLEYFYSYIKTTTTTDEQTGEETTVSERVVNADVDFMTAYTRNDTHSNNPTAFREAMLEGEPLGLKFIRQCASLNLRISKPIGYPTEILVKSLKIYFDADTKFLQPINSKDPIVWSDKVYGMETSATVSDPQPLIETKWDLTPEDDAHYTALNLLEADELPHFPPGTEINKVVFEITDGGTQKSYTWHPHIAPIVANTNYVLNFELDPARAN